MASVPHRLIMRGFLKLYICRLEFSQWLFLDLEGRSETKEDLESGKTVNSDVNLFTHVQPTLPQEKNSVCGHTVFYLSLTTSSFVDSLIFFSIPSFKMMALEHRCWQKYKFFVFFLNKYLNIYKFYITYNFTLA